MSPLKAPGEGPSLPALSSWWLRVLSGIPWLVGHITPTSASVVTWPPPLHLLSGVFLSLLSKVQIILDHGPLPQLHCDLLLSQSYLQWPYFQIRPHTQLERPGLQHYLCRGHSSTHDTIFVIFQDPLWWQVFPLCSFSCILQALIGFIFIIS